MLACCHDQGTFEAFQVFICNNEKSTVELGVGWDKLCRANNFQPGIIRFKFTTNSPHCMCHVYQLSIHGSGSTSNTIQ